MGENANQESNMQITNLHSHAITIKLRVQQSLQLFFELRELGKFINKTPNTFIKYTKGKLKPLF
jgi:hypothetical protein